MPPESPPQPECGAGLLPGPCLRDLADLVIPNAFSPLNQLGHRPCSEWMSVLCDGTEIIVANASGKPCPAGVRKAVAIVQSRSYLEKQARRLLVPFQPRDEGWQLVTIDFGLQAQQRECEFLMCFAFTAPDSVAAKTSPYVEVGFALAVRSNIFPMFMLTIQTATEIEL